MNQREKRDFGWQQWTDLNRCNENETEALWSKVRTYIRRWTKCIREILQWQTGSGEELEDLATISIALLRNICLPCLWCACALNNLFEDPKHSDESIYERGDGKSIDIVARRKARAERMRLPDNRRVSGRGTNARVATTRRARRQRKNNSSVYSKKGTARLRSAEGTFRVHNIYGDGNCLFRAVSYILWGNEDEHRSLRTLVTHHIKSHWREYGPFVTAEWNITSPDEYFDFMISEGVFATELECTVATKIYKMNLSIYREINDRGDVKRVFHNRLSGSYETARLLFSGRADSGHYDVLFLDS